LNKHWGLVLEWLVEDREENPGQTDPVQTGFRSDARQACIREISRPLQSRYGEISGLERSFLQDCFNEFD